MNMLKVSISLWSADLADLGNEVRKVEKYADFFHFDVADGHFVPNFLFFPDLIKAVRKKTSVPFEIHMIAEHPERFIDVFVESGANLMTVYSEAVADLRRTIRQIKKHGLKVSVALQQKTPVSVLEPVIESLDMVTVMGTDIYVKGKPIISSTYKKIRDVAALIAKKGLKLDIEADGGIRKETVPELVKSGTTVIVAGSLVFANKPGQIFTWLRKF